MDIKKILFVAAAVIIGIVLLSVSWKLIFVLICIAALWLIIDKGTEKSLAFAKEAFVEVFTYGKKKAKEAAQNDVEQELEIHDVTVEQKEDDTYELSVFTERGKLTLAPRKFNVIPEVLQKGSKVTYREVYTWVGGKIKKEVTLTATGKDGESRIFHIAEK